MTPTILPPVVTDSHGCYTFTDKATPEQIIRLAASILEHRISHTDMISNPEDTKRYVSLQLGSLEHETFCCLFLDNRHRVISFDHLFNGTINGTAVYPREVVKQALKHNAAAVIFAHNHPSGVAEPSMADETLTARLKEALALIDVRVLDHIVVGGADTVSFAERGLL